MPATRSSVRRFVLAGLVPVGAAALPCGWLAASDLYRIERLGIDKETS